MNVFTNKPGLDIMLKYRGTANILTKIYSKEFHWLDKAGLIVATFIAGFCMVARHI